MSRPVIRWGAVGDVHRATLWQKSKVIADIEPTNKPRAPYIARVYLDTEHVHSYFETVKQAKVWVTQRVWRETKRREASHGSAVV